MSLTIHRCSICGALRPMRSLAPYYPLGSESERLACEYVGCREAARIELRTGVLVDEDRRVA